MKLWDVIDKKVLTEAVKMGEHPKKYLVVDDSGNEVGVHDDSRPALRQAVKEGKQTGNPHGVYRVSQHPNGVGYRVHEAWTPGDDGQLVRVEDRSLFEDPDYVLQTRHKLDEDHDVAAGAHDPCTGSGYPPPDDPLILPGERHGQARFVDKHMPKPDAKRITDIDSSTLDDKLFKAVNIRRAVPEPDGDTHGHTPVGRDAAVYESLVKRVFKEESAATDNTILKAYGLSQTPHIAHAVGLIRRGMSHAQAAAETIKKFNLGGR